MSQAKSSDVEKAIATVNRRFEEGFRQADSAKVASVYAADGQILPPNMEPMLGREGVPVGVLSAPRLAI